MKSFMYSLIFVVWAARTNALAKNLRRASVPESCQLEIELEDCMVIVDQNGGFPQYTNQPCSAFKFDGIGVEHCTEVPYAVRFLYNGGGCAQSDNIDTLDFTCSEFGVGPPTEKGMVSYIVVTEPFNDLTIFFEGWVPVGSDYVIEGIDHDLLDSGFRIRIFNSDEVYDPNNLVQEVVYSYPLCKSNLEMGNRFGASQVISYENELQGHVSMFASIGFSVELTILTRITGNSIVSLTSLQATTNFAGVLDLSSDIYGSTLVEKDPLSITLEKLPTAGGSHLIMISAMAKHDESNALCTKTELISFDIDLNFESLIL